MDENQTDVEITEDFIDTFTRCDAINIRWQLLASLLSSTTAEIEQIKRDVIGVPSVKAAAMMNRWRERTTATYGILLSKVSCGHLYTNTLSVNAYLIVLLLLSVLIHLLC